MHTVSGRSPAPPRRAASSTPAERRDSILLRARAPQVLDSLRKAGYDTTALGTVQRAVNLLIAPTPAPGGFGGGAGGGRGGAGGGAGGGAAAQFAGRATPGCEHPMTQWDTFCARPAEPPAAPGGAARGRGAAADTAAGESGGGGGGGGVGAGAQNAGRRGGAAQTLDPVQRVWELIGVRPPAPAGRGGGGGFGGAGTLVDAGTYSVTLSAGGQTYKQTFRVERVGTGDNAAMADMPVSDEQEDINGGIVPKQEASPFAFWWWRQR